MRARRRSPPRLGISREEQDEWALRSHERAAAAWDNGLHDGYVLPIAGVARDESIRPGHDAGETGRAEARVQPRTARSPPATRRRSTTARSRRSSARASGGPRSVPSRSAASSPAPRSASSPERFSVGAGTGDREGPRPGRTVRSDIAVWEINEAFAAMVLSVPDGAARHRPGTGQPERWRDRDRAPARRVGAARRRRPVPGAARRGGGYGVAAACIGVGQGTAMVVQR